MKVNTKYRQIKEDFSLEKSELAKTIESYEPKSVVNPIPLVWDKAVDFSVYDNKGNKWIDLTCGIFVANAGHSNPIIKEAIKKQLDSDLMFAYNYPTNIKRRLLSKFLELSPSYFNRVILLNSGSEAIDNAYKLIKLWAEKNNKKYIITFTGSYHGRGLANDLICGRKDKAQWSGVVDENVHFIDFPYNETDEFDKSKLPVPHDQIAAFFLETFQGWGACFYPKKFINDLYQFAKSTGALVCFDEMQSGFYRLGRLYGYMTYGEEIQPDIICLGKGTSSSLPISAVLSREEIVNIDEKADLHATHSGNPVCCAAALANLEFLSDLAKTEKFKKIVDIFEKEFKALESLGAVKKVNVRGMIAGLIFDEADADTATAIVEKCIHSGVLPVCTMRNSIKIAPPLTISEEALREAIEVIKSAILESQDEISK